MLRITQVKLRLDEPTDRIPQKIGKMLNLRDFQPRQWQIVKESIDARKKPDIRFIYTVDFAVDHEEAILKRASRIRGVNVSRAVRQQYTVPQVRGGAMSAIEREAGSGTESAPGSPDAMDASITRDGAGIPDMTGVPDSAAWPDGSPTSKPTVFSDTRRTTGAQGESRHSARPVVIGFGPAGMFAALILAEAGLAPLVLERGRRVEERTKDVEHFWETGELDPQSNVMFGEGGAGTFSDGKLTTGIKDLRIAKVKEEFIEAGADPSIAWRHMPHIGTDVLRTVVKNIREKIIRLGGEIRFASQVTGMEFEEILPTAVPPNGRPPEADKGTAAMRDVPQDTVTERRLSALLVNETERIPCDLAILAPGHSARDTYRMLHRQGVCLEAKAFSVGARIEHPQEMIDLAQYGRHGNDEEGRLGAAAYKLSYHCQDGRGVYTFCMCPGGEVIASASEPGGVVTNGMSYFARDGRNANSAVLVSVSPEDCRNWLRSRSEANAAADPGLERRAPDDLPDRVKPSDPDVPDPERKPMDVEDSADPESLEDEILAGIAFQQYLEQAAFRIGGGGFRAPAQRLGDFLKDGCPQKADCPEDPADMTKQKKSEIKVKNDELQAEPDTEGFLCRPDSPEPTYRPGVRWSSLSDCLPEFVTAAMREAIPEMGKKLQGFDREDAILTGVETRSSSPVRIPRNAQTESRNVKGLFPAGEGAGYAGGIMSAAVDGIRAAESLISKKSSGRWDPGSGEPGIEKTEPV